MGDYTEHPDMTVSSDYDEELQLCGPAATMTPAWSGAPAVTAAPPASPAPATDTATGLGSSAALDGAPSLEERAALVWAGGAGAFELEELYATLSEADKDGMRDYVNEVMPWHRATDRPVAAELDGKKYRPLFSLGGVGATGVTTSDWHDDRQELGAFGGKDGDQVAVLADNQSIPMTVSEARQHALRTGSATVYDGQSTEQLQITANTESGYHHSVRHNAPETKAAVMAAHPDMPTGSALVPGGDTAAIVAAIGREHNDFMPIEMARTGRSADVIQYCNGQARSADARWAGNEAAKVMASHLPGTKLGRGADTAQAMMNVDEDGINFSGPGMSDPDEVRASMPREVYERCLAEWDPSGAPAPAE